MVLYFVKGRGYRWGGRRGMSFEIPDDLAPAMVAVLWDGEDMARRAVPATLLDLVQRGELALEPLTADDVAWDPAKRGYRFRYTPRDPLGQRPWEIGGMSTPLASSNQGHVVELAARNRLPAIYVQGSFVTDGGLMSYGPDRTERYRRIAVFVDKILKGTKPADLPVEQPTKFEFIINLKAAKQIGLTIPPNVLARADKVIR